MELHSSLPLDTATDDTNEGDQLQPALSREVAFRMDEALQLAQLRFEMRMQLSFYAC